MSLCKERNAEPIPGYRLIEMLGRGGCGEVWKCEAPGGLFKAIKFVYGDLNGLDADRAAAEEELRSIEHIKTIRHPFLLSMERVEWIAGELLIVSELADKNLHQVLSEYLQTGLAGIPREELLAYLRETAEVLDLLNIQYGLQHLDIKPRNLFLVSNHIKVADFGLVNSLSATLQLGAITPLYASPELFQNRISQHCDQYSLAITYQELLTGGLPFVGRNSRQLLLQHLTAPPNLEALPPEDRPVVARALAKKPEERFSSCMEFIRALLKVGEGPGRAVPVSLGHTEHIRQSEEDTDPDMHLALNSRTVRSSLRPSASTATGSYRFLSCLSTTPLVEVWEAEAPTGTRQLIKYLYGSAGGQQQQQDQAVLRLRALHHPALLPSEILENTPGRIIVAAAADGDSLRDYWQRCRSRGQRGIPRGELLDLLQVAAEGLDYLYRQHSLQHLGLNPRNIVLQEGRVLLDEFGWLQLLWLPGGLAAVQRNKRYAAPELLRGQISPSCDQYSLACIYVELLIGTLPRSGADPQCLELLSPADRDIIARALDTEPSRRWPSCQALMQALAGQTAAATDASEAALDEFTDMVKRSVAAPAGVGQAAADARATAALKDMLLELVRSAGGDMANQTAETPPMLSADGRSLHHKFSAGLPLGEARLKIGKLCEQLFGQPIYDADQVFLFHVNLPTNFWEHWIGRQPGLEVAVTLSRQHALAATPIEAAIQIKPFRCHKKRGRQLLENMGLALVEQIRTCLLVNSEKRVQDRLLWPYPIEVRPVLSDGTLGETVLCRGKDLSLSGVGFYLPHALPTAEVCIHLATTLQARPLSIPATLVRARPGSDGWYEVGALFHLSALRNSVPELCLKE